MRLTRRRALELAGAATAVAALRPATAGAAAFAVDVPLSGTEPRASVAGGWRTLAPVRTPGRFELIGLDFGAAAHVDAQLRARRARGPWTRWAHVHGATQPCWTGAADEFQVRFKGAAKRLQAKLVRIDAAPHRPLARAGANRAPDIIERAEWGGHRLPPKSPPDYGVVRLAFVHHTVTANDYEPEDSAGIVLGICRYHRDHNGWNDIGYNFLVDKHGQIFEGRDGGVDLAVLGAQAQGYNSTSTGVSCLGDYTSERLTAAGVEGVARLLAWKLAVHGVPLQGRVTVVSEGGSANLYRDGASVTLDRISGHRDGNATACPGEELYEQIGAIRTRAVRLSRGVAAITLRADSTELVYPDTVVALAGTLRFAGDADPAGATIQIYYQPDENETGGAAYTLAQVVTAGAGGAFATELSLTGSGRVRAVFAGDAERPPVNGTPIVVAVRPRLGLALEPRRVRAGNRAIVFGSVEPPGATYCQLAVHRRVGAAETLVEKRRVAVVDGVVDTAFRPREPGLYRVTLRANGARVRRHLRAV